MSDRDSKEWYIVAYNGMPEKHTGHICRDGWWWFPSAGFSTNRVFDNEESARAAAILKVTARIQEGRALLSKLGYKEPVK